jgi:hypothetical protein
MSDFPVPSLMTVTDIEIFISGGFSGQMRLGMYADNAGTPDALLVESSSVIITAGWNTVPVAPTNISPGTYWLAMQQQNSGQTPAMQFGIGQALNIFLGSYGPLPANASAATLLSNSRMTIRASGCYMTPTVTPTITSTQTVTETMTATPTMTQSNTPLPTATPSYTATPSVTPSFTTSVTPSFTLTNTPLPTATPSATPSNTPHTPSNSKLYESNLTQQQATVT